MADTLVKGRNIRAEVAVLKLVGRYTVTGVNVPFVIVGYNPYNDEFPVRAYTYEGRNAATNRLQGRVDSSWNLENVQKMIEEGTIVRRVR